MNDVGALAPIEEGDEDIEVEEKSAGNVDLSKKWSVRFTIVDSCDGSRDWWFTYNTPFASPWEPLLGPVVRVFEPESMIKHKSSIAYVGREDNKGEIAENILGGTTKAGTNLTITIGEGALRFGDG